MATKKRKRAGANCRPPYHISEAGHLLSTRGTSRAGKVLSREGKPAKRKRLKRGCLNGTGETFQLTARQKRNLPIGLQRAIIKHHRQLGKRIIS